MHDMMVFNTRSPIAAAERNGSERHDRRRSLIGAGLSLLTHGLLLFGAISHTTQDDGAPIQIGPGPLAVHLSPSAAPPQAAAVAQPEHSAVSPPALHPKPRSSPPIVLAKPQPQSKSSIVAPLVQPAPAPEPSAAEPMDMTAMLNAARERRRAAADPTARDGPEAQPDSGASSGNDVALANINRSVQAARGRNGTSGVFEILSKGVRTAQFSFRGWSSDVRNNWKQVVEVDAGPEGDVERAIVRKMIALIRSHFSGDFNWDSRRLGHVVVLSARPSDNAGLEDFLMREFFGGVG